MHLFPFGSDVASLLARSAHLTYLLGSDGSLAVYGDTGHRDRDDLRGREHDHDRGCERDYACNRGRQLDLVCAHQLDQKEGDLRDEILDRSRDREQDRDRHRRAASRTLPGHGLFFCDVTPFLGYQGHTSYISLVPMDF